MFWCGSASGADRGSAIIGGTLLNMAVFGAMFSYILQGVSFILLAQPAEHRSSLPEPARHPRRGRDDRHRAGDDLYQLSDPIYRNGVIWVAVWFVIGILYFALFGRNTLILSPEEEFAMAHKKE